MSAQIKELFRKYGRVAVGVHLGVYGTTFAGLYFAVQNKVDVESTLVRYGLLREREANAEPDGWFQKTIAGGGSAALLAFLCNKALLPVRAPITIGLTPVVARGHLTSLSGRHSMPSRMIRQSQAKKVT